MSAILLQSAALPLQGGSRVLKERLLPLVKHRRMDPLLLAQQDNEFALKQRRITLAITSVYCQTIQAER
jgi:hypothetical protein